MVNVQLEDEQLLINSSVELTTRQALEFARELMDAAKHPNNYKPSELQTTPQLYFYSSHNNHTLAFSHLHTVFQHLNLTITPVPSSQFHVSFRLNADAKKLHQAAIANGYYVTKRGLENHTFLITENRFP